MAAERRCPRCGNPLAPEFSQGACPSCLLRAGLRTGIRDAAPRGRRSLPGHDGVRAGSRRPDLGSHRLIDRPDPARPVARRPARATAASPWSESSSPEMPALAERGDRYQLFGEIARGGMGAILKGRDADLGRDLAVKVLLEAHTEQARAAAPVCRGGPDRRPAPAPGHRAGLRAGHVCRPAALLHHEAGQRADAGDAAGRAGSRRAPRVLRKPLPALTRPGSPRALGQRVSRPRPSGYDR